MKGFRLIRRMEAAGMIHWWMQYPEPIGPPDTIWGWSDKSGPRSRTIMVIDPAAEKMLTSILAD